MGWFWYQHSFLAEGRDWCERVLAMAPPQPEPRTYTLARVRALFAAGVLALQQGDCARARTWHAEGLRLATAIDDPWGIAWSMQGLGHTFARTAQTDAARQYLHDSLTRWQALGYRWGEAFALNWLGNAAYEDGDLDAAQDLYHQALAIRRFIGDAFSSANTLEYLARIRRVRGEIAAARELLEEALVMHQSIGDRQGGQGVAKAQLGLGRLAYIDGDEAQACIRLSEALRLFHRVSDRPGLIDAIEAVGLFGQMRGRVEQAARLFAAASRLRSEVDQRSGSAERRELEAAISALRSRMGDDAFREAWDSGWALSIEGAAESAQAELR